MFSCFFFLSLSFSLFLTHSLTHVQSSMLSHPFSVTLVASTLCCETLSLTLVLSILFLTLSLSLLLSHSCYVSPRFLTQSGIFSHYFSATLVVSLMFCSPSSLILALSIYSVHFRSVTLAFFTMFSQFSSVSRFLSRLFFESVFES